MKKLLLLAPFIVFGFSAFAQPANDQCSGAQVVLADGSCNAGTLTAANDNIPGEDGCATPGNANQHRDVWYSFVATGVNFDYNVTAGTLGGNINITIYPSAPCASVPGTEIGSACGGSPQVGSINGILTPGNTYYVVISSNGNAQGTFTICINNSNPPANDACAGAIALTPDSTCVGGTNQGAVDDITGELGCATAGGATSHDDVWYSFVATDADFEYSVTAGTLAGNIELVLLSTSGACGGLTYVNSDCGASPLTGTFSAALITGNTYYVVISSPNDAQGTFTLCIDNEPQSSGGQDCVTALQVCNNSTLSGNSNGFGSTQELPNDNTVDGCMTIEHQSSWYVLSIGTSGNLDITIAPNPGVDYDYALWGPSSTCPPSTNPKRCSYASGATTNTQTGSYNTGIGAPGTETSDGTGGTLDGWTSTLPVVAGESYILLIDNFSANTTPFNLVFGGSAGLSCVPLPVELISFSGKMVESGIELTWEVASEINNSHFIVEKRNADGAFIEIGRLDGRGNANSYFKYTFVDMAPATGDNYYRVTQVDYDGVSVNTPVINVYYSPSGIEWSRIFPNPAENVLNVELTSVSRGEIVIEMYDMTGRRLQSDAFEMDKGHNGYSLNLQTLKKGSYILRAHKDGLYCESYRTFIKN